MRVIRHDGPRAFLDRAEQWLLGREAENNLVLGLADALSRSTQGYDSPLYSATVEDEGEVQGCVFRTPPYKLGVTRMPLEAASSVAADVAEVYDALPAVLGPVDVARTVGDAWAAARGVRAVDGSRQRIHALAEVRFPARPAPGTMRPAEEGDLALLTSWIGSSPTRPRTASIGRSGIVPFRTSWTWTSREGCGKQGGTPGDHALARWRRASTVPCRSSCPAGLSGWPLVSGGPDPVG